MAMFGGLLEFTNLTLEYNNTQIGCRAELQDGTLQSSKDATLLLIQGESHATTYLFYEIFPSPLGLLPAVNSLVLTVQDSTSLSLNWTAPFTLDIVDLDPDITYCVEVANFTSSEVLDIDCGLTQPGFSYPIPEGSECFVPIFTVNPVNPAGNGTMATVPFFLTEASECFYA